MSLLVVGLTYRTAPLGLLERVAVDADSAPKVLRDVLRSEAVSEALVLSTCNRVEVYAAAERFHAGVTGVSEALARHAGMDVADLGAHLVVQWEQGTVEHVFRVASGLESMALGEGQILGQLRMAYDQAVAETAVGSELHELVQQALRVGKRVQTETEVGRAGVSLVTLGLELAEAHLGTLSGRRALLVGAGSMGSLAAATLRAADVAEIAASSRTPESARRLTSALCGMHVPLCEIAGLLDTYDVVVTAVGAHEPVLDVDTVAPASRRRSGRPLVIVDLGMPHNVEPAVAELPGVILVDLETIRRHARAYPVAEDVNGAAVLVAGEVETYLTTRRALSAAPTIAALRSHADDVVAAELRRLLPRVDVDAATWAEVERTVRRTVDKLLHAPTVRVRERAADPDGRDYARILRDLFELDPRVPEALSRSRVTEAAGREDR